MFLGEASYRPRTGLVQASYRPRTGAFYRRLEKRRRLRRLFSPWRLKVSTALVQIHPALTITAKLKIMQDADRHCQEGQERQRNEN